MLVKVPRVLSEYLEHHGTGTEIGILEEKDGEGILSVSLGIGPVDFPRAFRIVPMDKKTNMYTFTRKGSHGVIDAAVSEEVYVTPEITPEYIRYKKEKEKAENRLRREVKPVDSLREGIRIERHGASEYDIMARRRKKMLLDKKRERLAKTEVMDIIFKAFEEYPQWTVKDLADRSGQPQAYVQEILSEIAVINKKTHRNMYELKPDYK